MKTYFNRIDFDKDGAITRADFEGMAKRFNETGKLTSARQADMLTTLTDVSTHLLVPSLTTVISYTMHSHVSVIRLRQSVFFGKSNAFVWKQSRYTRFALLFRVEQSARFFNITTIIGSESVRLNGTW